MGSRMASNLLKNQIDLIVYNRSEAAMIALVEQGAKGATSYSQAAEDTDVLITMLSKPEVVKEIMASVLPSMKKNAIWMDASTVDPAFSESCATWAKAHDIRFLDTPVSGTKPHAENAQLRFFVGGEEADLTEVKPLLKYMGQDVLHLGGHGKGTAFKMLVNAMLAQSMIIFSEAVLLGESLGLDQEFLLNTLPKLPVAAPFTQFKSEMIRKDNYELMFPLEWMHKDLHLANKTAYENGQTLFMAPLAEALFSRAKAEGLGRADFAAIHKSLSS